jgi:hypothetical protein
VTAPVLERRTFSVSRAADFLEQRALVSQTGQPVTRFGDVVVKELLDNALDACETAKVSPEIEITISQGTAVQRVTVADNGSGIPAGVVERILDFSTLTSDKALYRSPCRGAQGNALKTIIGIPGALGVTAPVVIEARGTRHMIGVALDAAGNVAVRHDREPCPRDQGTAVTIPLPDGLEVDAARWARGYALVNPHATFALRELGNDSGDGNPEIYKATARDGWAKPAPGDPTSPWWYDEAAFARLAASLAAAGDDRPLGAFIAEFRGLSGTAKRKQAAAAVPQIRRISDLTAQPDGAAALLTAMRQASAEPKVTVLGQVPGDHYEALLDDMYGVERFRYRHGGVVADGIPWHIEVAIAETRERGQVVYGCNYGVSFADPLGGIPLRSAEVSAWGAGSFLARCDAEPGHPNDSRRAAVVHVTCAAPVFTDKGKTRLEVPPEAADEFARVLWQAGKDLYREQQSAERASRREDAAAERARKAASRPQMTKKDAVFAVIPEAVRLQRGGTDLPFSAHSLFYKIRPLFLQLLPGQTLTASYCEQTLIPAYEREHGPIAGMYREPRGELHEPHDRDGSRAVPLGTREVSAYTPPDWTFDKILVVEKAGLWPVLAESRIADRFDMAIVTSEGFAAEAPRDLLAGLRARDMTIFVLHDADHCGYNIARTLGEETTRMPGHHIEVIDLGLSADDAIALGMEPESYTRDKALPRRIIPHLSEAAREWFTGSEAAWDGYGRPIKWECRRVELNAFSSPGLVAYIEDGLRAHGADGKVVPPQDVLERAARAAHRAQVQEDVEAIIAELADAGSIAEALITETAAVIDFAIEPAAVRDELEQARHRPWRSVVSGRTSIWLDESGINVRQRVAEMLAENVIRDSS